MIGLRIAAIGRRLLVGHPLNGELDGLAEPFGPIFRQMNAQSPEERPGIWDRFLAGRDDADAIRSAVASAPVEGPLPEDDPSEGWPPFDVSESPAVGPFPVDVLPPLVANFVRVVADAIGCPPDFVGLAVLIAAGAAIGRSASLLLKPGYFASAALYGMNVGGPSSGKSPALEAVARPLWDIDLALHEQFRLLKSAYEEALGAFNAARGGEKPPKPIQPVIESAVLEDTTVEAVARHLALNPRGLLVVRDEGPAWIASLNQYKGGKGSDRQFWLSVLFGKPVRVDRKGNPDFEPIRVPHPFLALAGNLPPDMLSELADSRGRSDGLIERILFAFPDPRPRPYWSEAGIDPEAAKEWAEIIRTLRSRPMGVSEGRSHPHVVPMLPEARAEWIRWYDSHVDETNVAGFDPRDLATEGKLCDFAGRLALILHLIDIATDPESPSLPLPPLPLDRVRGAISLFDYFRSTHRRVRWHMEGGIGNPTARCILEWARRNCLAEFSESQLLSDLRWLATRPGEPASSLQWLCGRGALRPAPVATRPEGKRGRTPSPVYHVHPSCLIPRNASNTGNSGP